MNVLMRFMILVVWLVPLQRVKEKNFSAIFQLLICSLAQLFVYKKYIKLLCTKINFENSFPPPQGTLPFTLQVLVSSFRNLLTR